MSKKNKIALIFIFTGLLSGILLSLVLPEEKLTIALSSPSALVGAGLAQWSSNHNEDEYWELVKELQATQARVEFLEAQNQQLVKSNRQ